MEFEDIKPKVRIYMTTEPEITGECVGTGTLHNQPVVMIQWCDMPSGPTTYNKAAWTQLKSYVAEDI